jgi:hypothetical protein
MYIIKAAGCYLGDKDVLVDEPEKAHQHRYKKVALTHASVWSMFHQWIDGKPIEMRVLPFKPIHKRSAS